MTLSFIGIGDKGRSAMTPNGTWVHLTPAARRLIRNELCEFIRLLNVGDPFFASGSISDPDQAASSAVVDEPGTGVAGNNLIPKTQ